MAYDFRPHLDWIQQQQEAMVASLIEWADINSYTYNLAGLKHLCTILQKEFKRLDGEMEVISLPPVQQIDKNGNFVTVQHGDIIRITKHPHAPFKVFLGGHMDTVYPMISSFQKVTKTDPFTLVGPGVTDMKGGLVILLYSLLALERSPFAGKIGWELLINSDEEVGSVASQPYLLQAAKQNHIGLIFEPAFPDGSLVNVRKGAANYTIIAEGKSAHVGRDFYEGRNAITALAQFILKAEGLSDYESGVTINIGWIQGGGPSNVVPDFAISHMDVRVSESAHLALLREQFRLLAKDASMNGVVLTVHENRARPPKAFDKKHENLFASLKEVAKELNLDLTFKSTGGVCDGNILAAAGLPTIDTLGAVGGNIHTEEEFIKISSLSERAKLVALFLMQQAQVQQGV